MESILDYVRRRLKESGSHLWEDIARAAGCTPSTPRKVVYERENPGVNTIEPLYRYFQAVDRGELQLPSATSDQSHDSGAEQGGGSPQAVHPSEAPAGDRRDPATEGQFIHPHRRVTDMRDGPCKG